ncbi:MAG: hypothetical protein ACTHO8_02380 [Solirubrobacterales bacterium]
MSQGARNPTSPNPLSRRALQLAGVLSLLLIAVVVNSLLHSGSDSPFNPNPVAAAAERTQETPGMRMTMTMRIDTESAPATTLSGGGVYNGEEHLADFTYHLTTPQGARMEFEAIAGEGAWYFRYPQFASKLPEGKEWLKIEGLPGQSDESKFGESPQSSLQMLAGASSVRRLGKVRVRGVSTTRYRVTMTAANIVEALHAEGKDELAEIMETTQMVGPSHAEVFIDSHGMLRRMNTVTTVVADGKNVTTKLHSDLFDFGIHPNVQPPDDSQVLDLSPEQLEKLGQSS